MSLSYRILSAALLACGSLTSCASNTPNWDYGPYLQSAPRSILVLPPLDETVEPEASYGMLSAVTEALVEQGYYVFPVAVVDALMKENGLPSSYEMHNVSLTKLNEVFGPDAVLYLTVQEWGTSYRVITSMTTVEVEGRLIDSQTGQVLWTSVERVAESSGGGGFGIIGMLAGAVVSQVSDTLNDRAFDLAPQASRRLFSRGRTGLLPGPYHPDFAERTADLRELSARYAQETAVPN